MSDAEFAKFCAAHPDYFIEMTAEGELIIMPPNYSLTGARNQEIGLQLGTWAKLDGRGIVTEASSGFVLPNGARRSPDAAWTSKTRLQNLDESSLESFWHLCPDFVIELRSPSDSLLNLQRKMREYRDNGAQLGWLLDPERKQVHVYRPDAAVEVLDNPQTISGEPLLRGFSLAVPPIWAAMELED